MRAVVTGADGFAGRWLCRSLVADGYVVHGWVRHLPDAPVPGVEYRQVDVRDAMGCQLAMAADRPLQVFHLAAMTHLGECEDRSAEARAVNVGGTENVLGAMPEGAAGVFSSTCHVYGRPITLPMDESHPCEPSGVYARSKMDAENVIRGLGRHIVIARAFHHTGPGQPERYVLADWAGQIRRGNTSVSVGDVSLRRDFSDVRDIVAGYRLLCRSGGSGEVYNLCSGVAPTLEECFDWIRGSRSVQWVTDTARYRADDTRESRGDPGKAQALGWQRRWVLARTLADMGVEPV